MLVQREPACVGGKSHASTPDSSFQSGLLRSEGLTVACTTSTASRVMFVAPILPLASNAASINRWHTLMWLYVGFCDPQSGIAAKNGIRTRTSWCGTWDWPGYEVSGLIFWVDSPKVRSFLSCDDIEIVAFDNLSRVIGFESCLFYRLVEGHVHGDKGVATCVPWAVISALRSSAAF